MSKLVDESVHNSIDKLIMVYKLIENGKYARPEVYQIEEEIKIGVLNDLPISWTDVFGG